MKTVFLFALCIGSVLCRPQDTPQTAQILRYENDNTGLGNYKFAYETSDGVSRQEEAEIINEGTENASLKVKGSISWTAPDGVQYTINFIADENGYQPTGDHIPKA